MATIAKGGLRKVTIILETRLGYQMYWGRDEYPLCEFQTELEKLFERADLPGTYKVRQVGRQLKSDTEEWGITLAPPQEFMLELHAKYSRLPKKDVWEIPFSDQKELNKAYQRLEAVLSGQELPVAEVKSGPELPTKEASGENGASSGKNKTPDDVAYIILFTWAMIEADEKVRQRTLKEIFEELSVPGMQLGAASFHIALTRQGLLNQTKTEVRPLYNFSPQAIQLLEEHREALTQSARVKDKLQELEKLASQSVSLAEEIKALQDKIEYFRAHTGLTTTLHNQLRGEILSLMSKHDISLRAVNAIPRIQGFLGKV